MNPLPLFCRPDKRHPPHNIQLIIDALTKLTGDWSKLPSGLFELLKGVLSKITFLRVPVKNC